MDYSYAWGKFDDETFEFHRLEHHCADVAACFLELLRDPVLEKRVASSCRLDKIDSVTLERLAYIAYLHDFGKVNAGFQFQVSRSSTTDRSVPPRSGHIAEAVYCIRRPQMVNALEFSKLIRWGEENGKSVEQLIYASLAHHGHPVRLPYSTGNGPPDLWCPYGDYDPETAAKTLVKRGQQWLPSAFQGDAPPIPQKPELSHLFCGLVTLSDHIGSDRNQFPYEPEIDLTYWEVACKRAHDAVRKKGFGRRYWATSDLTDDVSVRRIFGYEAPRTVQKVVKGAPLDSNLLILESETGSGKTEAAILRFAALWKSGIVDGLYFALPTRAAAKQIHRRVSKALKNLLPSDANVETILAIPGYLRAGDHTGQYDRYDKFSVHWDDNPDDEIRLSRWAAESCRKYLSAPAAVGTIDQILLAGLKVRWAHLRGASLARSLLIVDEVHASSNYMSEILRNVLNAHLTVGGHALIMSATLGATARDKFLQKSNRSSSLKFSKACNYPYPVLTLSNHLMDNSDNIIEITPHGPTKCIQVTSHESMEDPNEIIKIAIGAVRTGAKVLIIRNTVASAQSVFSTLYDEGLEEVILNVNQQPTLHHSRFAAEDRKLLDDAVEKELGKASSRKKGKIIIGTQTLEQSLDIDADFLITDLCPMDVLLQRIGRIHRHTHHDRPSQFNNPQCIVLTPESGLEAGLNGRLLKYGIGTSKRGGIYENIIALKSTLDSIQELSPWIVPNMCRDLVERATHPENLLQIAKHYGEKWVNHFHSVIGKEFTRSNIAKLHSLSWEDTFDDNFTLEVGVEDQIRTRLGDLGYAVSLTKPTRGPFGKKVTKFILPAHLFNRTESMELTKDVLESATLNEIGDGMYALTVGKKRFIYDCRGVRRI